MSCLVEFWSRLTKKGINTQQLPATKWPGSTYQISSIVHRQARMKLTPYNALHKLPFKFEFVVFQTMKKLDYQTNILRMNTLSTIDSSLSPSTSDSRRYTYINIRQQLTIISRQRNNTTNVSVRFFAVILLHLANYRLAINCSQKSTHLS